MLSPFPALAGIIRLARACTQRQALEPGHKARPGETLAKGEI